VPDGIYRLRYKYHATLLWKPWRSRRKPDPKIVLYFEIADGEYAGTLLFKYYNVASVEEAGLLNGKFTPLASAKSKLLIDCRRLQGWRTNDVSLDFLRGRTVKTEVQTVDSGFRGPDAKHKEPLPWEEQYSTISRLICLEEDDAT
jgi:hypothetical protein